MGRLAGKGYHRPGDNPEGAEREKKGEVEWKATWREREEVLEGQGKKQRQAADLELSSIPKGRE